MNPIMSSKHIPQPDAASIAPSEATTLTPDLSGPSTSHLTRYNMYYTPSMLNCTLHLGSISTPVHYYMESKSMTFSPRILLRRPTIPPSAFAPSTDASKTSPIVAFAKARLTSRNLIIGLGDCESKHAEECTFEELSRDKNVLRRSDWRFATEDESGKRMEVVWKKDMGKRGASAFDAVEEGTGRVLGRMLSGGAFNWEKGGEIWVDEQGVEERVRDLLVVSAFGIWVVEALNYRSLVKGYGKEEKKTA